MDIEASHVKNICLCTLAALLFAVTGAAAQDLSAQPPIWAQKPGIAAFDKIEDNHLSAAQHAIATLVAAKAPRTIANTVAPYDEAVKHLNAAGYFAGLMKEVHHDTAFRDAATAMVSKASAVQTALALNHDAYQALAAVDLSGADAATRYYVQRQLLEFQLAGVDRDAATRERLKKLNDQLTGEQSLFDRNISDGELSIVVNDKSELAGVPQDYIERHKPGADGKIHITTSYPDVFPVLKFATSDALRQRLTAAYMNRAYPKNRDALKNMMRTRYEIATTLGFASWADYSAKDKMIGNGSNIAAFIKELDAITLPVAQRETAMLLAEKQKLHPGATEIWDYENWYYPELVRRAKFNFDSQTVRPYFPYKQVEQGILATAAKLFRVTFRREPNAPSWDAAVETWDVFDNGTAIGRFYLDMHPRTGKYSHDAEFPLLDGVRGQQLPEAALICNLPEPTASDPGLMEIADVETFFHEFGHLMHHILGGRQQWAGVSGISMEGDFVEAPSQMLEELIRSPVVLATFAHHYKSGQPIPAELVARMNRASAFRRAGGVASQNAYSAISYDVYKTKPDDVDLDQVTEDDLRRYATFRESPGEHFYASFGHLSGYSSAYYTYMWDKVIAEDFYAQFDAANPVAGEVPMKYRHLVLEPGGSMSANDLVKAFLGRAQNTAALKSWISAEFAGLPAATTRQEHMAN
jgi:thimet oligopeptidase